MQDTDSKDIDWSSDEGKQATARLNHLLKHIDKSAAQDGLVRTAVPLGTDENGEPFGLFVWSKP